MRRAALLLAVIVLVGVCGLLRLRRVFVLPEPLKELVEQQADAHALPPSLLAGLIFAESRFVQDALSPAGAVGLMQLTPDTFAWLRFRAADRQEYDDEALLRPEVNIRYGSYNMALLMQEYDRLETALAAYNAGRGRVNGWLLDAAYSADGQTLHTIPYSETAHYVKRVQLYSKIYHVLYYLI